MAKGPKLAMVLVALVAGFFVLRKTGMVPGATPKIEGARFAGAIPVFPGAKFRDTGGGNYYDEIGGPVTFTSKSWYFDVSAPVAEVAAWYRANLPAGATPAPEEEVGEGEAAFNWTPPGAREGEEVSVYIEEGEFRVSESVKAGS